MTAVRWWPAVAAIAYLWLVDALRGTGAAMLCAIGMLMVAVLAMWEAGRKVRAGSTGDNRCGR